MKKILFAATAAILLLTTCGAKKSPKAPDGINFQKYTADSTIHLTEDSASPTCEVSLSIFYAKGTHAQEINDTILRSGILVPDYLSLSKEKLSVKVAVDSFIKRYLTDYKQEYREIYRQDPKNAHTLNNFFKVTTNVSVQKAGYFTYAAEINYYGGGAHGITQTIMRTFDEKTGKVVHLRDLFAPGYEETLNGIIKEALMEKYEVDDWKQLADRFFFADGKIYAPDNFILSDSYLTLIYCSDEIAPHAEGEIRLPIDIDDLDAILK